MTLKSDKGLDQNHFEYLFEQQVEYSKRLKQENDQMREVLKLIWETDALQGWAWEDPEGEGSIADWVRKCVKNIAE